MDWSVRGASNEIEWQGEILLSETNHAHYTVYKLIDLKNKRYFNIYIYIRMVFFPHDQKQKTTWTPEKWFFLRAYIDIFIVITFMALFNVQFDWERKTMDLKSEWKEWREKRCDADVKYAFNGCTIHIVIIYICT